MAQVQDQIRPLSLNLDASYEALKPTESPFIKNATWDINGNPLTNSGTNNPTGEGQNMLALTPYRSNAKIDGAEMPDSASSYNKCIGSFQSLTTQELYHFNYNSNGKYGIYVVDGNNFVWQKVIEDVELGFSADPKAFIADVRCTLRSRSNKFGVIVEKHLILSDGTGWQKWINVIAAIKTDGFNANLYPYWKLQPPHFDRRELLEYATRPPMYKPTFRLLPNTEADNGKVNEMVDRAFQICYQFQNTDGRSTTSSPYSLPIIVTSTDYLTNPENIPKKAEITFYAGSPLTEKMLIFVREATVETGGGSLIAPEWGDWKLYDTINKFTNCGVNDEEIIGTDYWLRQNQWSEYEYDTTFNTIKYIFDNSKAGQIAVQDDVNRLFTAMPLRNKALAPLGDAVLMGNNQYDYDNFSCATLQNIDATVLYKEENLCLVPSREISLYAYAGGRMSDDYYYSNVGWYNGDDKSVHWGGISVGEVDGQNTVNIDVGESKIFNLDFSDSDAFKMYLKGTPFYVVGELYAVDYQFNLSKVESLFDASSADSRKGIYNVYAAGGYFVWKFTLKVPAGRYLATLGRHNVSINADFRNTSTYIMGLANSRIKTFTGKDAIFTVKPQNAIVSFYKEMEIDCVDGNVDVWGNGMDLFYVYVPSVNFLFSNKNWKFIEFYLKENSDNNIPVECFPYAITSAVNDDSGTFTDKNGFGFAYSKSRTANHASILFTVKLNCVYPTTFDVLTGNDNNSYDVLGNIYLSNHNGSGACNRMLQRGKITNIDGTIPYSNIAVSIFGGATTYTNTDGEFELIVHNGMNVLRIANVYINSSGNFQIMAQDCAYISLYNFNELLLPCEFCNERISPVDINAKIVIISSTATSLKEGGRYTIGAYCADYAGRLMYVNIVKDMYVPSFLERDNILASYFRLIINGALNINPEMKWFTPCVTKQIGIKQYVDWVGDKISYIDNQGNVTTEPTNAVFCAIYIQSFINANINSNFTILAKYQFAKGDRVKIYDDGNGNLLDVATFGDPIDLQVWGTNYNQAAINAGLIPPQSNTVFNTTASQTDFDTSVTLIVKYDSRLNKLIDATGFWIEIYTPQQIANIIPFNETAGFYPVIDGSVTEFKGYDSNGNPYYVSPAFIDIDYWDTYLIPRNISIPNTGDIFFNHLFNSPNVNDSFGANLASGGRQHIKNDNAKQMWYIDNTIKSDDFVKDGVLNGLATFRNENKKDFRGYEWGGIMAIHTERSIVAFICENDWFTTDYNFHYVYANEQGVMITNLNEGLSTPHQKVGGKFGVSENDIGTVIVDDKVIYFYDRKNTAFVEMNYVTAIDVSEQDEQTGTKGGVQSYINAKTTFIAEWNTIHGLKDIFDVVCGYDAERSKIFLTFRPRRNNSNNQNSYVNQERNVNIQSQETLVYDTQSRSWTMFVGFTPEAYGQLKGNMANVEMFAFAAGLPYYYNNTPNTSYLNFFGINTERIIMGVFNNLPALNKINQSIAHDSNPYGWYVDLIFTNIKNSFSYIPLNYFKKKENVFYAPILRNANSYPNPFLNENWRSMLIDGNRMFGRYLVFRMVGDPEFPNEYTQLNNIYILSAESVNNKK